MTIHIYARNQKMQSLILSNSNLEKNYKQFRTFRIPIFIIVFKVICMNIEQYLHVGTRDFQVLVGGSPQKLGDMI